MKPWFILIGLAVAVTAASTVALPLLKSSSPGPGPVHPAPPKPEGPTPTLTVEEDLTHKFGVLPQQYKGKHSWVIKNTGAGSLELRGTSSTCSCTTSDLFEILKDGSKVGKMTVIPPGESQAVEVSFDTKTNDGNYRQTVTVATNDPSHPELFLVVEGTVRPAVTTYPADPSINFLGVSNEEPTKRPIFLYSADRPDLKVLRLASSNPSLIGVESRPMKPEELASLKAEKGYAIEVTARPSSILGDFAEEVVVETDHPMRSEVRFRVKGRMTGPISVVPEKVTMHGANSGGGGSETLTLWARGRTSVHFTVDKKPAGMEVAIEAVPPAAGSKGSKYKMNVKLAPGTGPGRIADDIVLKTDDPKVSELRVPVDMLVQGAN